MIIHHIKPRELQRLAEMFGRETKAGIVLPDWLLHLQQAVPDVCEVEDFQATMPELYSLGAN